MPVAIGLSNITVTLSPTAGGGAGGGGEGGGHTIEGWSDADDALMLPDKIPVATAKFGADGHMAVYSTGQRGGPVMYKLLPTSRTTAFLYDHLNRQREGEAASVWNCTASHDSGAKIQMEGGILTDGPLGPRIGAGNIADEEFEITYQRIYTDYTSAELDNAGPGGGAGSGTA
jgi:hypothetical protein